MGFSLATSEMLLLGSSFTRIDNKKPVNDCERGRRGGVSILTVLASVLARSDCPATRRSCEREAVIGSVVGCVVDHGRRSSGSFDAETSSLASLAESDEDGTFDAKGDEVLSPFPEESEWMDELYADSMNEVRVDRVPALESTAARRK